MCKNVQELTKTLFPNCCVCTQCSAVQSKAKPWRETKFEAKANLRSAHKLNAFGCIGYPFEFVFIFVSLVVFVFVFTKVSVRMQRQSKSQLSHRV